MPTIQVRLATTDEDLRASQALVREMFSRRGYGCAPGPADGTWATFLVATDDAITGTLTLHIEGPLGLSLDRTFADELEPFRARPDARLAELTRLAFRSRSATAPVLKTLFRTILVYGKPFACTDLLIEVAPRHSRFYEAALGFHPVGEPKRDRAVNSPAQLLHASVSDLANITSSPYL